MYATGIVVVIVLAMALLVPYLVKEIRKGKVTLGPRIPDGVGDAHICDGVVRETPNSNPDAALATIAAMTMQTATPAIVSVTPLDRKSVV